MGARPDPGEARDNDLVHQRDADRRLEDLGRQVPGTDLLAGRVAHLDGGHPAHAPLSATPLTRRSPRSASACTTSRFKTVTRTLPCWPAIGMPLKTRLGVAHAPIAPGARCLRFVPWLARRPWNPCRFITPVVP